MTYEDFEKFVQERCMYETIYDDSDGRPILVIRLLDAYGMVNKAAALAEPEQEPVAWADKYDIERDGHDFWVSRQQPAKNGVPLYTSPPQREWQTLTENEIKHLWYEACQTNLELTSQLIVHLARNIEAKLKEKNT